MVRWNFRAAVLGAVVAAAGVTAGARGEDGITLWNANTSAEVVYRPLGSEAKVGDFVYVDARKLHPTQFCLGYREVNYKAGLVSAMKADKGSHDVKGSVYAYLAKKDVPIILGPDGTAYLTDGHHTLAALIASTQADKTAFGHVVANFSRNTEAEFRAFMENPANNDMYLFGPEGNGLTRMPMGKGFEELPKVVYSDGRDAGARMANDVYRSLGWGMKESGYSSKDKEGKGRRMSCSRILLSSGGRICSGGKLSGTMGMTIRFMRRWRMRMPWRIRR